MKRRRSLAHKAMSGVTALLLVCLNVLPVLATEGFLSHLERLPRTFGQLSHYQAREQESLLSIARRFGVSLRSLRRANPEASSGTELLIPAFYFPLSGAPGELVLNLAERMAYVYDAEGQPAAAFPVAIGRRGWETPTGEFIITRKAKNPTWFPPSWAKEEEPVPPGPRNPLGDRWMGLSLPGYGLHATNDPPSIGRAVSHGCLRLYPEHARALYQQVNPGTRMRIVYETILLGYSPLHRAVYISIHPDIYQRGTNTLERARDILLLAGLEGFVEEEEIRSLLKSCRGLPVPLLGSDLRLRVNGAEVPLPFGPTPRGDDYLVSAAPLAAAFGATLSKGPEEGWYLLRRGEKWFAFAPGRLEAKANQRTVLLSTRPAWLESSQSGRPTSGLLVFLPLKAACDALGASLGFDPGTRTLYITDLAAFSPQTAFPSLCSSDGHFPRCDSTRTDLLPFLHP